MRFWLSMIVAAAALAPALPADNWPAFRGPNEDGTAPAANVPTKWSETENVVWKTPVHGKGWASPVVWDDQIWVTTADEVRGGKAGAGKGSVEKVTFFAVCVDRTTGKIVHDVPLASESNPAFAHDFNSYASPTPVVEAGRVYAHFGSHGTWCLDTATGKVLWERRDLKCDHFRGPGSSPIVYQNLLVLIFDGADQQYVAALDKLTGRTVWRKDRGIKYASDNPDTKKAYATARVLDIGGKPHLVAPSAEVTIAYDPLTGDELWRFQHTKRGSMNVGARTSAGNGLLYLVSGHPAQLMAVKQSAVGGAVPKTAVAWETDKAVPSRPSLVVGGDLLFMVSDGGVVSCLDAKTGAPHWSERLGGQYTASPVLAGGHLYLPNEVGKTTVLKASKDYEVVAVNSLDAGCMASPAVTGDTLLLRTKTHLYAIGKK